MSDIEAFLQARLAETEAIAQAAANGPWHMDENQRIYADDGSYVTSPWTNDERDADLDHIARNHPKHILSDVALKRDIIDLWIEAGKSKDFTAQSWVLLREIVYAIAALYSDHPDHDPNWKPIFGGSGD